MQITTRLVTSQNSRLARLDNHLNNKSNGGHDYDYCCRNYVFTFKEAGQFVYPRSLWLRRKTADGKENFSIQVISRYCKYHRNLAFKKIQTLFALCTGTYLPLISIQQKHFGVHGLFYDLLKKHQRLGC